MPGPVLTVTVAEATRRGFWAGPLVVLGHGAVEVSLFLALVLGLGGLLQREIFFASIGIAGGGVLLWMGWGLLRKEAEIPTGGLQRGRGRGPLLSGALTTLSNPYFILWWATVGLSYIALSERHGSLGLTLFYSGHIMADIIWYFSVAAAVAMGRSFLGHKGFRLMNILCGLFLLFLGGYFGLYGLKALIHWA